MIYLAIAELAALGLFGYLLYLAGEHHREDLLDRERAWRRERSELLNRIQRPSFTPPPESDIALAEPRERDEIARVGKIVAFDRDGEDEEAG